VPEGVFQLLRLVNMGILDECARSSHPVYEDVPHPCIERINFQSAPSAEPPRGHGQGVPGDPIYCLSPQHALVREANGEKFYLLSRKRVCKTWPESSSWPQVLSLLDGQRTLFQALAATALRFEDIHQDLLAGLEEGYLRPLLSEADEQDYQNTQSS
jgi:hypothetical protein